MPEGHFQAIATSDLSSFVHRTTEVVLKHEPNVKVHIPHQATAAIDGYCTLTSHTEGLATALRTLKYYLLALTIQS